MKTTNRGIQISVVIIFIIVFLAVVGYFSMNGGDRKLAERQSLGLSMVWNDRQLGGYIMGDGRRIKDGLLLRSGRLIDATEDDINILYEKYDLKTVVDLRNDKEIEANPDVEMPGVRNIQANLYPEQGEPGFDNHYYIRYLATDTAKAGYRQVFTSLLENEEGAFLWHCKSGKDRTGLASMLILSALGADEDLIMQDFLLTNTVYKEEPDMPVAGEVKEEDMRIALNYLNETYGSPLGYIKEELGLTDEDIQILKDRYLEENL
ncbi:MAG: tyrosine-protein phosphatase [Lachnospiraceae bacterium]|nr:tyrosine-protein phosphatase [Lachnospiraceae bacterium]